ncbi:MAG TPA: helix-turn-helix transcriptional regulator [Flavobacteriaceae bacterium]|nr:helix-turn-helix transcriptional regulator [Flavobacteriaceae bacterium]
MKSKQFGIHIKNLREAKKIPQRIVAHALNIDTSTLSKMELGERQISISKVKPLADILKIDYKELQVMYISEKVMIDFEKQPYLKEAINHLIKELSKQ